MSSRKAPQRKPRLGQNFLIDPAACQRIAEALGDTDGRTVLEIGPGHGVLTERLAPRCAQLHCVELDPALARELTFHFRNQPGVTIHNADILAVDLAAFLQAAEPAASPAASLDVLGNLPYYITSDILLHLFAAARQGLLRRAVLMVQREVADRIAAVPGTSEYGALSAFTQMHSTVTPLFTLPPDAFAPPPEVFSMVVRLDISLQFEALQVEPESFNRFLRASFAQKRKTLANNLRVAGYTAAELQRAWPAQIPAQARSEAVPLAAMAAFYRSLGAGTKVPAASAGSDPLS